MKGSEVVAHGLSEGGALISWGDDLYVLDVAGYSLWQVQKEDGVFSPVLEDLHGPLDLAADEVSLWLSDGERILRYYPGSLPLVIAEDISGLGRVVAGSV